MIEKAYIEKIINKYTYRVRVLKYNKIGSNSLATVSEGLSEAQVCTLPGSLPYYKVGDLVWVSFEASLSSNPVILGQVYIENDTDSKLYLDSNSNLNSTILQYENRIQELESAVKLLKLKVEKLETL